MRFFNIFFRVHDYHVPELFGNGLFHAPFGSESLFICLACGARARGERADLEPGVILKQGGEPLTDHTCCAYDTYFEMLHDKVPPKNVFE